MEKILILFRGVPGAGKTSLCASLGIKAMSADMFFEDMADNGDLVYNFDPTRLKEAHAWCQKHTGISMEMGVSPVGVANTFTQEWEMEPYFELAAKHGYKIFFVEYSHLYKKLLPLRQYEIIWWHENYMY